MNESRIECRGCARAIPHDAAFCIYCAAPTGTATGAAPTITPPATGATIRLRPADAQRAKPRPQPPIAPTPHRARTVFVTPMPHQKRARKPKHNDHSFLVFIIGALFLAATGMLWPWFLVLIGVTKFVKHNARGKPHRALSRLVFWVGLAGLWYTPYFLTGGLVLLVVSHLIGKQHQRVGWA